MNNNNFRNAELLQKLARHPLKSHLARALDASELFAGDVEHLKLDKNLSEQGRDNASRSKLRAALRDNRDARQPLREMQAKLDAKRKAVAMPAFDKADVVGFLSRQELRATLRTMDAGQRALLLSGHGSVPEFVDAMLEQPPILSGLLPGENFIVEAAKEQRLGSLFESQILEISELESVVAEANSIFDLALIDLKLHSEMDDRTFIDFSAPIMNRKNAPWLVRDGDKVLRVRPELRGTAGLHQIATPEEISDGVFSEAEYLASRVA